MNGASISGGGGGGRSWSSTTSVSSSGKRIQKEMIEFNSDPPADCAAGPKGDNLYNWISVLIAPQGLFPGITQPLGGMFTTMFPVTTGQVSLFAAEWFLEAAGPVYLFENFGGL